MKHEAYSRRESLVAKWFPHLNLTYMQMKGKRMVAECKFDGDRMQVHKDADTLSFWSRYLLFPVLCFCSLCLVIDLLPYCICPSSCWFPFQTLLSPLKFHGVLCTCGGFCSNGLEHAEYNVALGPILQRHIKSKRYVSMEALPLFMDWNAWKFVSWKLSWPNNLWKPSRGQ